MGKIRIKVGLTEIEFEGSEEYMREELPRLLELLNDLSPPTGMLDDEASGVLPPSNDSKKQKLALTTNTIATKLRVHSGSDLALAACIHLCLVKGADTFRRANILAEMKLASNYYKQTYSGNLSKALQTLVKAEKLLETAQDTYALVAKEKVRVEAALSGS